MARPTKAIVDYFPHYANHGKTMFTLESKYGNDGYAFWFKTLELLSITEHHFIDCRNIETWEFLLAKTRVSEDIAVNILNLLSKLGSIDIELWENKIIWSENFISNLSALYSRRSIKVYGKQDIVSLCIQKPSLTVVIEDKNTQSIVKYSIEKNSIEETYIQLEPEQPEQKPLSVKTDSEDIKKLTYLAEQWNLICIKQPKIATMNKQRKDKEAKLLKSFSKEQIIQGFKNINESTLCGNQWLDYDWLLRGNEKQIKMINGAYKDNTNNNNQSGTRKYRDIPYEENEQYIKDCPEGIIINLDE